MGSGEVGFSSSGQVGLGKGAYLSVGRYISSRIYIAGKGVCRIAMVSPIPYMIGGCPFPKGVAEILVHLTKCNISLPCF